MGQFENVNQEIALAPDLTIGPGSTEPLGVITSSAGTGVQVTGALYSSDLNTKEVKEALFDFFRTHNEEAMKEHAEQADVFVDELLKLFDIRKKVV